MKRTHIAMRFFYLCCFYFSGMGSCGNDEWALQLSISTE